MRHAVDCPDPEFLSPQSDSLDVAWAEVEAALPDGDWFFRVGQTPVADDYDARAMYAPTGYAEEGRGDTPAAALRALAAMLRER